MVTKYFFLSVSNSHFQQQFNDEEVITTYLMCVIKQLFHDENMFERKKQLQEKTYLGLVKRF